jgi:hypothetical protein
MTTEMLVYRERGGIWLKRNHKSYRFFASWPFAALRVSATGITLGVLWRRYVFPADRIVRLVRVRGMLNWGIRIEHSIEKYPAFIVYWTFRPRVLADQLRKAGFQLDEG